MKLKKRLDKILESYFSSLVLAGIIGGIVGIGIFAAMDRVISNNFFSPLESTSDLDGQIIVPEDSVVTDVVQRTSNAVVSVIDKTSLDSGRRGAIGSGFIISPDGLIVTAAHVVDNPSMKYYVITHNSDLFPVQQINRNIANDVALISISASNLPVIPLGNSDELKPGEQVIAIGTILGRLENSVSVGVISALGRDITAGGDSGSPSETLSDIIQVDAPLNPGNSGGPLLDLSGSAVGINFAVTQNAQNVGFAIPINVLKSFGTTLTRGII